MSLSHDDPRLRQRTERLKRTKVEMDPETGCWHWQGATQSGGYGTINIQTERGRSNTTAHRLFYVAFVGDIPQGETVHHKCGTRSCVNPAHLEAISQRENAAEMFERSALHARIEAAESYIDELHDQLRPEPEDA